MGDFQRNRERCRMAAAQRTSRLSRPARIDRLSAPQL